MTVLKLGLNNLMTIEFPKLKSSLRSQEKNETGFIFDDIIKIISRKGKEPKPVPGSKCVNAN